MAAMDELRRQVEEIRKAIKDREPSLLLPAHEKFSFKQYDWDSWRKGYERYRQATKLNQLTQNQQVNQLLLQMGNEVDKRLSNVNKRQEDFPNYEEAVNFFNLIYPKKINVIYERAKFNSRNQRDGETAEEYISVLLLLVKNCKYGQLSDELVRDRLVVGIKDRELSGEASAGRGFDHAKGNREGTAS